MAFTERNLCGTNDPLISIIIPNKDHIDDLKRCMDSIDRKSAYKNYEYVIVENNSTDPATFEYYKKLERENERAHVVYWDGVFNYSAINNYGASFAKGEYLLSSIRYGDHQSGLSGRASWVLLA